MRTRNDMQDRQAQLARSAAMLQWLASDLRDATSDLSEPEPDLEALTLHAERLAAQLIVRSGQGRLQ